MSEQQIDERIARRQTSRPVRPQITCELVYGPEDTRVCYVCKQLQTKERQRVCAKRGDSTICVPCRKSLAASSRYQAWLEKEYLRQKIARIEKAEANHEAWREQRRAERVQTWVDECEGRDASMYPWNR